MAKAKKKKAVKKFIAMRSNCGNVSQLAYIDGGHCATAEAAKKAVQADIEYNGSDGGTYAIVEIIDVGRPTGMTWGATLD